MLFIAKRTDLMSLETIEAKHQNYYSQLKALCYANTVDFVHGWHGYNVITKNKIKIKSITVNCVFYEFMFS